VWDLKVIVALIAPKKHQVNTPLKARSCNVFKPPAPPAGEF
jgi:hypothetical protein